MSDFFVSITEAIKNQDPLLIWVFGVVLTASLFLKFPKLRHRRCWIVIIFPLLLLSTITLYIQGAIAPLAGGILIVVVGSPIAWWLLTTVIRRAPLLFEKSVIASLADWVHNGNFFQAKRRFARKPLRVISVPAKLEWSFLKAKAHSDQGDFKEGYALYTQLLSLPLFQEERTKVQVRRICTLCALGDTLRAMKAFECIEDVMISDGYDQYWLRALLTERAGKLKVARTNWLHAVGENTAGKTKLAKGYNNLGRIEGILHNRTEALHYYNKAALRARQSQDRMMLHSVYPNLIDTLLLNGEHDRAASALEEYNALVDQSITEELVKLYNYHLAYARQTGDRPLFAKTLRHGQTRIVPRLSYQQRLIFEVCELRIRYNGQVGWMKTLRMVEARLDDYFDLDFPQQYWALKEIFGVLRSLAQSNHLGSFRKAFVRIVRYMEGIDGQIRDYLEVLPDYCVFERCSWEKERAWLLKFRKELGSKKQYLGMLKQMVTHLENIKDIHLQHRNPLEAIEADLNIVDEAMAQITQTGDSEVMGWGRPVMAQRVAQASDSVKFFANHPKTVEYNLRIARYALFLGDRALAKYHFKAFRESGVNVDHYASWLQDYYIVLKEAFQGAYSGG
jgi:tetratricopeptide (TPR) repeat protein